MLKVLVIVVALMIAAVNVSAKTERTGRRNAHRRSDVIRIGPSTTYLKEGLTADEVVQLLGKPTHVSDLGEGELLVSRYEFQRGGNRILIAEFVNNALVSSRTETIEHLARADH